MASSPVSARIDQLFERIDELRQSHEETAASVRDLKKTWDQASGILNLVKWLSIVGAAITATVAGVGRIFHHG